MSTAPISGTGGVYQMGGASYDIETLMMAIGTERANSIEQQMVDQANAMKIRNQNIKALTDILGELRAGADSGDLYKPNEQNITVNGKTMTKKQFLESQGIGMLQWDKEKGSSDWKWGKEEKNEAIEKIKGTLDSLNSDSQMDMIRLQGLVNKRDQAFEMVTNLISKFSKTKDAVVANLR